MVDTNPSIAWQEVKENQADESGNADSTNSIESADKVDNSAKDYKVLYENMQKAMNEERAKRKEKDSKNSEIQTEYDRLKAEESKRLEEEKKKKWKFEELLQEKNSLIEELKEKAENWEKFQSAQKEKVTLELAEIESKVPQEVKEQNSLILNKLDEEGKIAFYNKLLELSKKPDFSSKTETNDINNKPNPEKGDLDWMLDNIMKGFI